MLTQRIRSTLTICCTTCLITAGLIGGTAERAQADRRYPRWQQPHYSYSNGNTYNYPNQSIVNSGWNPSWGPNYGNEGSYLGGTSGHQGTLRQLGREVGRLAQQVDSLEDEASRGFATNRAPRGVRQAIDRFSRAVYNLESELDGGRCESHSIQGALSGLERSGNELDRAISWNGGTPRGVQRQWQKTRTQLYRVTSLARSLSNRPRYDDRYGNSYEYRK